MKKQHHWLDIAEYASLVGIGVGSVASFVSQQVLFTSAPLSLMLALNLVNRRRLDQLSEQSAESSINAMDRKLNQAIEMLNHQMQAMPSVETLGALKKSILIKQREQLSKLTHELTNIQQELKERLSGMEKQNLGETRQKLTQLETQYHRVCDAVAHLTAQSQQSASAEQVDQLDRAIAQIKTDTEKLRTNVQTLTDQTKPALNSIQDQINYLNRQFQKLPPPFDSSALKQEVSELIRVVADLVPKRDWTNLVAEIKALSQQQETYAQNEELLRRRIHELSQQLQSRPAKSSLTSLQNQINHINREMQKMPEPFDASALKKEIAELIQAVSDKVPKREWSVLVSQVNALQTQQEFQERVEQTLRQELSQISQQLAALGTATPTNEVTSATTSIARPAINRWSPHQTAFQTKIEATLQQELQTIEHQLQDLSAGSQQSANLKDTVRQELRDINQQLTASSASPHYRLVFDFQSDADAEEFDSSRAVLEEALDQVEHRLILIWPWSSQLVLDSDLFDQFDRFLRRGCRLDLGWCHQSEPQARLISGIYQRWMSHPQHAGLKDTLQQLLKLKRSHPDRFQFKILGTNENFLVADETFAVLGTDHSLTEGTAFADLELKLRTNDADVIQQLIQRFENPTLDPSDQIACWNRAITRYDLGDREGAIQDLTQMINAHPNEELAFIARGVAAFDLGHIDLALADFDRALAINPEQYEAYLNRGYVYSHQGDQLGAIADYSLAIQSQENAAIAFFLRGIACQKFGDPHGAINDFADAIKLAPNAAPAYYYRGITSQKIMEWEQAIKDFDQSARLFQQRGSTANAQKALSLLARLRQNHPELSASALIAKQSMKRSVIKPTPALTPSPRQPLLPDSSAKSAEVSYNPVYEPATLSFNAEPPTSKNGSHASDTKVPNTRDMGTETLDSFLTIIGADGAVQESDDSNPKSTPSAEESPNSQTVNDFFNQF